MIQNVNQPAPAPGEMTRDGLVFRPNVDIIERADELLLMADVPGAVPEQIDIHFEDRQLTVRAPIAPRDGKEGRLLAREYRTGDYYRSFMVSEQIDATRIRAEMHNGVLVLHLPKAEIARPRKIVVNA